MVEMLQVKVVLVALLSCALLVQVSTAQRTDMLTETLRGTLKNDKDLVPLLLLKIVSEVIAERAEELLPRPEEEGEREQMMRRHLPLSQRERKAGCRNFFWKTFTSC